MQRVVKSSVEVDGVSIAQIRCGLMVLLGIGRDDTAEDGTYLAEKILNLRIFPDTTGKMNLSLREIGGEMLVVSQFTLYGDCRKGRRPSFDTAAAPDAARELYQNFIRYLAEKGVRVSEGRFQTDMMVHIDNQGPVTLLLDSQKNF